MIDSADDLHCYACEYNLRGLPADGKCPECGESIAASWIARERRQALAVKGGLREEGVAFGLSFVLVALLYYEVIGDALQMLHWRLRPIGGLDTAVGAVTVAGVVGLLGARRVKATWTVAAISASIAAFCALALCILVAAFAGL